MEPAELLQKYNPVLVLLPQDPSRPRPWSRWYEKVDEPRGDYHPCSVEFFLGNVAQRDKPRAWSPLSFREPAVDQPLGWERLKERTLATNPQTTRSWELDVAAIRSQVADEAWRMYGLMLTANPWPQPAFVYARYVAGPPTVLCYWYLYVYNDAPNRHEGDWESVFVELDANEQPVRAGYAGHSSGFQRPWERVETHEGRPVVYVSRGSHAAYFAHRPEGHRTNSLSPRKGWPEPLDSLHAFLVRRIQNVMWRLRLVDHTASNPNAPVGHPRDQGVLVDPHLVVLPDIAPDQASGEFWWMRLLCRWGSRHSRIKGTIGPNPPWEQGDKWHRPSKWLDSLVPE